VYTSSVSREILPIMVECDAWSLKRDLVPRTLVCASLDQSYFVFAGFHLIPSHEMCEQYLELGQR
jgi:hypothetical protein